MLLTTVSGNALQHLIGGLNVAMLLAKGWVVAHPVGAVGSGTKAQRPRHLNGDAALLELGHTLLAQLATDLDELEAWEKDRLFLYLLALCVVLVCDNLATAVVYVVDDLVDELGGKV